ncbi:MAG: recombinase XerD, partial [Pseudonocardia sp.]|nr:recombinase XerD [Pseudonocardia sp.]
MPLDLTSLLDSWQLHLRAERKSPRTVVAYTSSVQVFLRWCASEGRPAVLDRPTVNGWVAAMLDGGAEANTARVRQHAVRRFSAWLVEEDELDRDELLGLKPPKLDQKVTEALTDAQC